MLRLRKRSLNTQPVEQTNHGVSSGMEFQVDTLETLELTKVEIVDETAIHEVDYTEQLVQSPHSIVQVER